MVDRRLGRGLEFFLSGDDPEGSSGEEIQELNLELLVPSPHQPRREFAPKEIEELASSIRSAGILQPILARRAGDRFQIVAGERRWRAAKLAGLERIPALVRDLTDEQAAVFGLVENLHREDLNPIEKAKAFRKIQELAKTTQEEVARQVGLDRSTIANFVRILECPGEVQALVAQGHLSMGHARALLGLKDSKEQRKVADEIVRRRLSVRQVEALVQDLRDGPATPKDKAKGTRSGGGGKTRPAWLEEIEDTLEEVLGTSVRVRYGSKRAKIVIECDGRSEFERVYGLLKGE